MDTKPKANSGDTHVLVEDVVEEMENLENSSVLQDNPDDIGETVTHSVKFLEDIGETVTHNVKFLEDIEIGTVVLEDGAPKKS